MGIQTHRVKRFIIMVHQSNRLNKVGRGSQWHWLALPASQVG